MFKTIFKGNKDDMNWKKLTTPETLDRIIVESESKDVLIFKHSTRCSVSAMVKNRIEREWNEKELLDVKPYFLDIIAFRGLSDEVARRFGVPHQSPQVLVIRRDNCIYDNSHYGISYSGLKDVFSKADMI